MNVANALVVIGAGGHARVILDVAACVGAHVTAIYDDVPRDGTWMLDDVAWGGTVADAHQLPAGTRFIVAIGNNETRMRIGTSLMASGLVGAILAHPSATISPRVSVGAGTVIMAGAVINAGTSIGEHVIVNTRCSIDHDCHIDDGVHVAPGATLCGDVTLRNGAFAGAGSTFVPGARVGRWTTIGAGSTVLHPVPDGATVVGSPARVIRVRDTLPPW